MNGNEITIVGNVTRDPELKFTPNGQAVTRLSVASSRRWQANGEWKEQTTFFDVTAWGSLAENAADSLKKGSRALVVGRIESREYEKDGQKRVAWDVTADELGPSLRWATAVVTKAERQGGSTTPAPASQADSGYF